MMTRLIFLSILILSSPTYGQSENKVIYISEYDTTETSDSVLIAISGSWITCAFVHELDDFNKVQLYRDIEFENGNNCTGDNCALSKWTFDYDEDKLLSLGVFSSKGCPDDFMGVIGDQLSYKLIKGDITNTIIATDIHGVNRYRIWIKEFKDNYLFLNVYKIE